MTRLGRVSSEVIDPRMNISLRVEGGEAAAGETDAGPPRERLEPPGRHGAGTRSRRGSGSSCRGDTGQGRCSPGGLMAEG